MKLTAFRISCIPLLAFLLFSCKREVEDFKIESVSAYLPLQPGKYITYQLDSTVFTNFGRSEEIHSYQEKNVIDSQIVDNLNRPSYRIFRYLRDSAGSDSWRSAGTYFITPSSNEVEVVENNLRTIRLVAPIQTGTTWKGNRYLPTGPFSSQYSFNNDDNMADWDFSIDSTNETITLNGQTINNVITVKSADEAINVPITDPNAYAARTLSVDKFAKDIGLVFQELIMWEYQPNTGGPSPYKVGFGVKRTLLDHN